VMLEQAGYIELMGRIAGQSGQHIAGYHFQVASSGAWKLYSEDMAGTDVTLASGTASFPVDTWHTMSLRMVGNQLNVIFDGKTLATVNNSGNITGNVALRVSGYQNAEFDNVKITPTEPAPVFVPHAQMTVTASDTYPLPDRGDLYSAAYAIDDRPESLWHSNFNPRIPPPHTLTIDLGGLLSVQGLTYQPRIDGNSNGMINTYNVYLSTDGVTYKKVVSSGTWPTSIATKIASWPSQKARFVRLEETAGVNGLASVGELNIYQSRWTPPTATAMAVHASNLRTSHKISYPAALARWLAQAARQS
jgi:hypothetical protein